MLGLVFLWLVTLSFGKKLEQSNITFVTASKNPYIQLSPDDSGYPARIEYLQDINPESQLMSRIIFLDEDVSSDSDAEDGRNLCDILEIQSNDPIILEWQYMAMTYLGLEGETCPIKKGIRPIGPSIFPGPYENNEPDYGGRLFIIRIEHIDQPLDSDPILELRVYSNMRNESSPRSQPDIENTSSIISLSMLLPSIIIGLFVMKFIK